MFREQRSWTNTKAIQNIRMKQKDQSREEEQVFVIPAHTLYGNYPPKIAEEEIKPVNETGEIVLSRVVVPEYIIVHDGSPRDSTAQDYYVKYKDYIKNVASSEIVCNLAGRHHKGKCTGNYVIHFKQFIRNGIEIKGLILQLHHQRHLTINGSRSAIYLSLFQ